jgi:hypothetical protein
MQPTLGPPPDRKKVTIQMTTTTEVTVTTTRPCPDWCTADHDPGLDTRGLPVQVLVARSGPDAVRLIIPFDGHVMDHMMTPAEALDMAGYWEGRAEEESAAIADVLLRAATYR